jgi:hypothetical protein
VFISRKEHKNATLMYSDASLSKEVGSRPRYGKDIFSGQWKWNHSTTCECSKPPTVGNDASAYRCKSGEAWVFEFILTS